MNYFVKITLNNFYGVNKLDRVPLNSLKMNTISMKSKNIFRDIFIKPCERKGFAHSDTNITLPIYFCRIIGINNEDEDEYYNTLFNLDNQLSKLKGLYERIDTGLGTALPKNKIDLIGSKWDSVGELNNTNAKYFVERLYNLGLLPVVKNRLKDLLIQESVQRILELFVNNHGTVNSSILKNFFVKLVCWIEAYGLQYIINFDYNNHNPKLLFYGDIKKDEIYFLIFMSLIGFDILYINPLSDCNFTDIDRKEAFSYKLEYNRKTSLKPFPLVEKLKSVETIGYQVSREVNSLINTEASGFYKPWQFENYKVKSIPLRTTYEELFLLWKEPSSLRTGFEIKTGTVYAPNIFAKINGTNPNLTSYWTNIFKLIKDNKENLILTNQVPFTKSINFNAFNYKELMKENGLFNKEKIFKWKDYALSYLRTSIQNVVIEKINELVASDNIFLQGMNLNFKIKILLTVLNLEKKYYNLLQKFDYPFAIPKLIIYDNNEAAFSEEDFITLAFLHSVGFDIIILTPTGYNNVENGINRALFDIHYLEELKFGLPLSRECKMEMQKLNKASFAKRWFNI